VLSSKAGQIDGTLVDDKSRPLPGLQAVLVPDQSRYRIDLYKTTITDQNGHFTIHGITPGDYKIFAWEAMEPFAYFDSDFVRQSEQKGKPVNISESSKITADVKVISAPQ
jgi:Carboxypeptidase regulatory-like domain